MCAEGTLKERLIPWHWFEMATHGALVKTRNVGVVEPLDTGVESGLLVLSAVDTSLA